MAAIETTFPGSSVQTNTSGLPIPSGGDFNNVLAELLKQKLLRVQAPPPQEVAPSVMRRAAPVRHIETRDAPPMKSALDRARERAELLKLKAAENGPRLHYTGASYGAPQMAGVLTTDPQSMNAYERGFYTPEASSYQPDYNAQQRQQGMVLENQREQQDNDRMALEEQAAARRDAQLQALYYGIRR